MSLPETYKILYSSKAHHGKPELREVKLEKPGKDQVLIKVEYVPINPTDILSMENKFYTPDSEEQRATGSEGSGTIVAVGEDLKYSFKVGDKVHFLGESMGQYRLAETDSVFPVQAKVSLEEAASHWVNPATVYYMGVTAQKGGHKAVVHTAGSSALGRMLIRYFKKLGIKLVNVVRREEYVEELKKEGADFVLNSTDKNFEKDLRELCEKEKVTMALEAVSGDFTNTITKALPNGSAIWVYGVLSSVTAKVDVLELFKKKTVQGLFLPDYMAYRKEKGESRQFAGEVHSLLDKELGSKVQKVFKLEELEQGLEYYNKNSSKGKVLLKPN